MRNNKFVKGAEYQKMTCPTSQTIPIGITWLKLWKIPFACLVLLAFASCSQPPNTVKGYVEGLTNDTVFVVQIPLYNFGGPAVKDTLFAKNGRFEYKFPNDGAYDLLIQFPQFFSHMPIRGTGIPETAALHIFVEPDDKINFKCRTNSTGISSIKTSGSKVNADYSTIQNKIYEIFRTQAEDETAVDRAIVENNKEAEEIGVAKRRKRYKTRDELFINYVKENLDNPVSAFLLNFSPSDSLVFYYDKLGENVRNSIFRQMLDRPMEEYIRYQSAGEGTKAPDFTLEDMNGKLFSLSSLLGKEKYVIIDFWGSWCIPCVKGIPQMKSLYEKNKNKIEIVGIACDEPSIDAWQNAVKRYKLPWINVYDESLALNKKYGIKNYPTKIIIDPEGTILFKEEGEGKGVLFYTKLEALLNK